MELYHGSADIIRQPVYGGGKKNNDFGRGFYCTKDIELAKEWAVTSESDGFANAYGINLSGMRILNLNSPEYSVLDWMSILVQHRLFRLKNPIAGKGKKYLIENFGPNVEVYDVIIGYRADDAYFDYADAFLNNALTVNQLARALKLGRLGEQLVLKSRYAIDELQYVGAVEAERNKYYTLRKSRNDKAMQEYLKLCVEEYDGLYLSELIRERVDNSDERISGILFE